MNILAINPFKIANRESVQDTSTNPFQKRFGLTMAKPLSNDTVSFGSSPKILKTRTKGINKKTALQVEETVAKVQPEILDFFEGLFEEHISSKKKPQNLIAYIIGRFKKADSIVEKSNIIEADSKGKVLENMTDLNGVKIVLQKGDKKSVHKVLDILSGAIKRKSIILREVETKRPVAAKAAKAKGECIDKYDYADPEKLENFVKNAQKYAKKKIKYEDPDYTPANYTAIHFLFNFPAQERGFELQLMGPNVAIFKDFDDVIFKILDNKNVGKIFKPIEKILKPLVINKNDKKFLKYIKIREKMDKLKFSEQERNSLLERVVSNEPLSINTDNQEFIEKVDSLLKSKNDSKEDFNFLVENMHLEADYQDKIKLKKFKNKVTLREKFDKYRGEAFLYQRTKNTSYLGEDKEHFLPLNEDLSPEYDMNELYQVFKSVKSLNH